MLCTLCVVAHTPLCLVAHAPPPLLRRPIELLAGGSTKEVTFANRKEYVDLAISARLHEFDAAVAAIRRGMVSLVPERALRWFTWREMEVRPRSTSRSRACVHVAMHCTATFTVYVHP